MTYTVFPVVNVLVICTALSFSSIAVAICGLLKSADAAGTLMFPEGPCTGATVGTGVATVFVTLTTCLALFVLCKKKNEATPRQTMSKRTAIPTISQPLGLLRLAIGMFVGGAPVEGIGFGGYPPSADTVEDIGFGEYPPPAGIKEGGLTGPGTPVILGVLLPALAVREYADCTLEDSGGTGIVGIRERKEASCAGEGAA